MIVPFREPSFVDALRKVARSLPSPSKNVVTGVVSKTAAYRAWV
jgi:hypothetical protein